MTPETALMIIRLVDLVAGMVALAPEIAARYEKLSRNVKAMVAEGRDPTAEEWAELDAETSALVGEIAAS